MELLVQLGLIKDDRSDQLPVSRRERRCRGIKVNLQTFALLHRERVRNALRTGAARYRGRRVISGEARGGYPAFEGLRLSLRSRFTEQCPRVVVGLKQGLSGRRETRPCLSSHSMGRYIAPEHRAVFAKLPHERGQPEIVVVPGLKCESVEFSFVHVGPTQKSDPPRTSPLGLQYWSCNLFRALGHIPRGCFSC